MITIAARVIPTAVRRLNMMFPAHVTALAASLVLGLSFADAAADTVMFNGKILTMDEAGSVAEAIVVRDGKIDFVGSSSAALRRAPRGSTRIDLKGQAVLPGFYDAHSHFPATGISKRFYVDLNSPPLGSISNIDELVRALGRKAAAVPPGTWIRGIGYDDTMLMEKRHPTRFDLDKISPDHPIYITHISGHLAVANSVALKLAGIGPKTDSPANGRIQFDRATNQPNGVLEETAMRLVDALVPPLDEADVIAAIGDASKDYAAVGITNSQNGATGVEGITTAIAAHQRGLLTIRHKVWPVLQTMDTVIQRLPGLALPDDDMIAVRTFKEFADGSIQGLTGYLRNPYDSHAHTEADFRGYTRIDPQVLTERITRAHTAGWQVAVHANGDAAIDEVLDAIEAAQAQHPRPDARHIVVHAQMATDEQLGRMKRLGVIPSFFILHTYYWGDRHRDVFLGPERAARISPAKSAVDMGMKFTIHADTPVVPMNPLRMVWSAVNRLTTSGQVLGPEQRIDVAHALRAITSYAAYQNFEENKLGSIEVGKLADLVILDRSPFDVPPVEIVNLRVLRTIVGGKIVFDAERP